MSLRRSKGKARPELPRRRELRVVAPERAANEGRAPDGRFAPGNRGARNRGWKLPISKILGRDPKDPIAAKVAADAFKTYCGELRELPSDGPIVRSLAAQHAHHVAIGAFWAAQAFDRGLATPEGIQAQEHALKHGQRAERLAVTMIDVSSRMATAERPGAHDAAIRARLEEYNRRNQAEVANAAPEGAQGQDEGFVQEADEEQEPHPEPQPDPEPEDSACNACGDPDPTRGGIAGFCCSCGAKRRTAVRIRGEVH